MSQETPKTTSTELDPKRVEPHPDDVIHVPKGSSRTRFLLTFLLVVLVLTTFTVSDQVLGVLGGRDTSLKSYMTWKGPDGSTLSISGKDFLDSKRSLATPVFLGSLFPGASRDPTDEQTATFLLLDRSALDSGVRVTDSEVKTWIVTSFQKTENYNGYLARYRLSPKDFERTLRRVLRVNRYRDLLASALSVPDPAAIEKKWKSNHQEYQFDYVDLPVANLVTEARGLAPKGAELKVWFDALPDTEKDKYKLKPALSAELAAFSLEGDIAAEKLLAKYPRPADEDAEKAGKDYHQGFGYIRYPAKPDPTKPAQLQQLMKPWDEVGEQAKKEAPVYNSLMDWVKDLGLRTAKGETIDLAAEAALLGLTYRKIAEPRNVDGWKELAVPFVGKATTEMLFDQKTPGSLFAAISVDEKAFVFGRVLELQPTRMPEFAEIEAQVSQAWADKKAKDLALERLEKIRDALGTRPDPADANAPPFQPEVDAAKFADAVKAAGFEVKHREWRDRQVKPTPDDTAGETYIRSTPTLYTLKENTVTKAALDAAGTTAYLVRVGGLRDPDIGRMKLDELDQASRQAGMMDKMMFQRVQLSTKEFLQQRYGLDLEAWHKDAKPAN